MYARNEEQVQERFSRLRVMPKYESREAQFAACVDAVDDAYAVSLLTVLYLEANRNGEVYASNEVMAERAKMGVTKLKKLKRELAAAGVIKYRSRRVQITRFEVTVWSLGDVVQDAIRPDDGRDTAGGGSSGDQNYTYISSSSSKNNITTSSKDNSTDADELTERETLALGVGYRGDTSIFNDEKLDDATFDEWIQSAEDWRSQGQNGGGLLRNRYRDWVASGKPAYTTPANQKSVRDADYYTGGKYGQFIDS